MEQNAFVNIPRRQILKGTALAVAAGTVAINSMAASAASPDQATLAVSDAPLANRFWLTNVRLETGFAYDAQNNVEKTLTGNFHLLIHNGKIEQISDNMPGDTDTPRYDMQGALAAPSFSDMHVHIDKANYGGPWKASSNFVSVRAKIREEEQTLPSKLATATEQAKALLALMTGYGTTNFRIQCNIDPTIGLKNFERIKEALASYQDKISYEIVAFPQHGLLTPKVIGLIDEALTEGCNLMGGLDPATIDNDIEKSLAAVFELAVKHNVPVDIHLHNPGHLGTYTISRICHHTKEAKWQGKVTVSHAYCLGAVSGWALNSVLDEIAEARVALISSVPVGGPMPSPEELSSRKIDFMLGTDCINDMWSSFGNGNMLERASLLAERFGWDGEYELNRALKYITRGVTPLDDQGKRVWPASGDTADLVFTKASCTAEMIARRSPVMTSFKAGKVVIWQNRVVG